MKFIRVCLFVWFVLGSSITAAQERDLTKVSLIPQWTPQAQFAGYYVAYEKGLYGKVKRDVLPKGSETPLRIYEVGGIAGRFNLALQGKDPALVTLARHIPLRYTVLEGKNVGEKELEGSVVRLSKNCAEITLGGPVSVLTNLRMNLADVDEKLSARDFYGKVIERAGEKGPTQLIRFTSVPPEIDAYFQAHLQLAAS